MYSLQMVFASSIILLSFYQGLTVHKSVVRSFYKNKSILRTITKGLHKPKSKTLHAISIKGRSYVKLKLKKTEENKADIKSTKKKYKIDYIFDGFLSHEN